MALMNAHTHSTIETKVNGKEVKENSPMFEFVETIKVRAFNLH